MPLPPLDTRRVFDAASAMAWSGQGSRVGSLAGSTRFQGAARYGKRTYAYKRSRIGRNRPRISTLCKTAVLRLQGMNAEVPNEDPDDVTVRYPGFFSIGKGLTSDTQTVVPFYFADLTRFANSGDADSGPQNFCVGQMQIGDTGNPTFVERGTQVASGVTSSSATWQLEKNNTSTFSNWNATYVQNMWYDIRLKMYGSRKQTVTYDIWLCRFKDDNMCPSGPLPNEPKDIVERNAMYANWVRPAIINTIFPPTHEWAKKIRVIRKARYTIQPSLSTELERNPDSVDLKWFVRDTKITRYSQNGTNLVTDTLQLDTVAWAAETTKQYTNDPTNQRSRLFLIIRATDMTATVASDDQDDTPSFDMCIRKKIRMFPPY